MVHRVQNSEPKVSLVMDDQTGLQYLSFASREETRAWIRRLKSRMSPLELWESGPPSYKLTEVGSKSFLDAYKRIQGRAEPAAPEPSGASVQSRRRP